MLFCLEAYAFSFVLVFLFMCLVPGGERPEEQVRRVNPGRATSKRYRTFESIGASSSAAPPPQHQKKLANRPKPRGKTVTVLSAKKFWERHRRNPYAEDQEPNFANRPFWNRFQFASTLM